MKILGRVSMAAVLVAFGAAVLGSWTRINGAGMTCPDWPLCHGTLIPAFANGTIWEWTHRLFAFAVSPLVFAVALLGWRERARSRFLLPTLVTIALLFVVQVALGAATVHLSNSPASVVLHWGTAMALIAALMAMSIFAHAATTSHAMPQTPEPGVPGFLVVSATVAFVTMCLGAYVSASGAGLACLSIPGCAGNVVVYTQSQDAQMLHRIFAAATLLCAAGSFAFVFARPASTRVRVSVSAGLGLVFIQVLLGLANVALRLPTDLREAHAVNAALLFLTFVAATIFAALECEAFDLRTPHAIP